MTDRTQVFASSHLDGDATAGMTQVYQEGIIGGVIGAATLALWFFIVDSIQGRPFYTPTVLGEVLFHAGHFDAQPTPASFNSVLVVTWLHGLIFCVMGGIASRLLAVAERRPNFGFGILLLFVIFECGFIFAAMTLAYPVLRALDWSEVLIGNLLAAATMALYFRQRHPRLRIAP